MKRTTVTTLVANLRRAIARCLDRISGKATRTDSRTRGTSRIGNGTTTGALCPDVAEMTVRKQRLTPTWCSLFLSLRGVNRRGNPVDKATTGRNPLDCRVGPLDLLAMTRMVKTSCSSSRLLGSIGSAFLIAGIATMPTSLPAAEQDNWYLANEWSVNNPLGVAHRVDSSTDKDLVYVCKGSSIGIYEMNGTLVQELSGFYNAKNIVVDANGTMFIVENYRVSALDANGSLLWRTGKNANSGNGSSGSGDGEFLTGHGIALSPTGELFVGDYGSHRIQVLDKNGSFKRKFGSQGSAPGQLYRPLDLVFLPDGKLVVADNSYLHYFESDGNFIKRTNSNSARRSVSIAKDGTLFSNRHLRDSNGISLQYCAFVHNDWSRTCFTPEGDLIESSGNPNYKIRIWKRAYRTKGLATRNVIPQPAIRSIAQRAGTNIIDLDFEIVDPDDNNATVGILAAVDGAFDDSSKWILPSAWVDGTQSKIGTPIATNQVHRVSWNVKPDWPDSTGTLKFEIICRDARRTTPVDLHFLTLPLPDGNLTISRSPLKDSDFESYAKFLLTTGQAEFESNASKAVMIPKIETNATQIYTFTNAGATGKNGPTPAQLVAEYNGTSLQGSVTVGFQSGYQKWTVPATGTYVIEAVGARGGSPTNRDGGYGAFMRGEFNLTSGQGITILVGHAGIDNPSSGFGAAGGGGTFVVADINNTPLIIAGGGSGAGGENTGSSASTGTSGLKGSGYQSDGGLDGHGGQGGNGGGGGGFLSNGTGGNKAGKSFQSGAVGGEGAKDGGFGGGGATHNASWNNGGGGGGYSGGGGATDTGGTQQGGGGSSFNSGSNQFNIEGVGNSHGLVRIFRAEGINSGNPKFFLLNEDGVSQSKYKLLNALGTGYRYATPEEVTKAREAATAGGVNQWTAIRPIQPRNLPNKVNEYGFDTGDHGNRAWWIVQE